MRNLSILFHVCLIAAQSLANTIPANNVDSKKVNPPPLITMPNYQYPQALSTPPLTGYQSSCQTGFCNYFPSTCTNGCNQGYQYVQPIIAEPLRTPQVRPETIIRKFPKSATFEEVPVQRKVIRICVHTLEPIDDEDDVQDCEENEGEIQCPVASEWEHDRCVERHSICAQEHTRFHDQCISRTVCPTNYIQRGDECFPPEPRCPIGWRWNGKICEPERLTCPFGYTLSQNSQCIKEVTRCPSNYRTFGNHCVKEEASCPSDYRLIAQNVCEKSVNTCPAESYEQYGKCFTTKYGCPAGTKTDGDYCTTEETTYVTVNNLKPPQPIACTSQQPCNIGCNSYPGTC